MAVDIRRRSRLRFAQLTTIDGYEFWDLVEYPTIVVQDDDSVHLVLGTDRLDLLAYKYYGDPVLWWVIAVANDMELVPTALTEGSIIRIPSARYINQILFSKTVQ